MRSPNNTVISYGKNPKARTHAKPQYYAERHIVSYQPFNSTMEAVPDYPSKAVPALPNLSGIQSQYQNKSSQRSLLERSKRNDHNSVKTGSGIDFERLYYLELEKNKNLEDRMFQLSKNNEKLHQDKKAMRKQYEDFIQQLQKEAQESKLLESQYNDANDKRRRLEEELNSLKIELDLMKRNHICNDDEVITELRERIKSLNQEKIDILDLLDRRKKEITNLRAQLNYQQEKEKANANKEQRVTESLRNMLQAKDNEIEELRKKGDEADEAKSALRTRDADINTLKNKIEQLNDKIADKDKEISDLTDKVRELENTKQPIIQEPVKEAPRMDSSYPIRYPTVERLSIVREPAQIERTVSPPPTVMKRYTSSPDVKSYTEPKKRCCCCSKCDYCLDNINNKASVVTTIKNKGDSPYKVQRVPQYENIKANYRPRRPNDYYYGPNSRGTSNVTRISINNDRFEPRTEKLNERAVERRPYNYNTSKTNVYNTPEYTIPRIYTPSSNNTPTRLNSKSLELYRYCDSPKMDEIESRQDIGNGNSDYGNMRVSMNEKPIRRPKGNDSARYRYGDNGENFQYDNSNVFNDRRVYGNDSNNFSEYNYM